MTEVTLVGRLARDPELRFIPSGKGVTNLTVVTSDRRRKAGSDTEWEDINVVFWRCTAWEPLAERVAETLTKGDAVILQGNTSTNDWEDKDGNKRRDIQVTVRAIGPDLRWMEARTKRPERTSVSHKSYDDPWSSPAEQGTEPATDPWTGAPTPDEPPF